MDPSRLMPMLCVKNASSGDHQDFFMFELIQLNESGNNVVCMPMHFFTRWVHYENEYKTEHFVDAWQLHPHANSGECRGYVVDEQAAFPQLVHVYEQLDLPDPHKIFGSSM